jgi:Domain of unknown function (DUF6458)
MTIGSSIFLIVIGAILRYAVTWTIASVNLHMVGLILMIAGVAGIVLAFGWMFQPRRSRRGGRRTPVEPEQPPYGAPYGDRGYPVPRSREYDDDQDGYGGVGGYDPPRDGGRDRY